MAIVLDHFPQDGRVDKNETRINLEPDSDEFHEATYDWTPDARGDMSFGSVDVLRPSPFGLWHRADRVDMPMKIRVIPDISAILGSDLMSFRRWLDNIGVKSINRKGRGEEFHQLREFQDGDSISHVDWKATSKAGRPIVKSYVEDKDRRIHIMLDCGSTMATTEKGVSHFNQAVKSMLLLAYAAIRRGDEVGLQLYNRPESKILPPRRDARQIMRMIETIYDAAPTPGHEDFELAVNLALESQRRRALFIIVTHINFDLDEDLLANLKRIKRRHPLLVANLRDPGSLAALDAPVETAIDARLHAGGALYRENERRVLAELTNAGVRHVNCAPGEFTSGLVNNYIAIRRDAGW